MNVLLDTHVFNVTEAARAGYARDGSAAYRHPIMLESDAAVRRVPQGRLLALGGVQQ